MQSLLEGKNVLKGEQFFLSEKGIKMKMAELFPLKEYPFSFKFLKTVQSQMSKYKMLSIQMLLV